MEVEIEYTRTHKDAVYGGFNVENEYEVNTVTNGIMNRYTVWCRIAGLTSGYIWNEPRRCKAHDNNEETLTERAVLELFEDNIC
jgi:hypothetical protein